jgi:beta-lactamase superfamily II metal-dependent hydrolase
MNFELDFMPVGEGEKSGDAICFRYVNLQGDRNQQTVVVVDGGTKASGEALVQHIRTYYGTTFVDSIISTHPDLDHTSGLTVVMENLDFGQLVMHRPWEHATEICDLFKTPFTPSRMSEKLRKAITSAHELEILAKKLNKPVVEPFTGASTQDGCVTVLGPSQAYYQSLLPEFRETPAPKVPTIPFRATQVVAAAGATVAEKIAMVAEALHIETLRDDGVTSAENNSSVILLLNFGGTKILLGGDAGIPALSEAATYAAGRGIALNDLYLMQIPHHGSRRNVGPSILNQIMGRNAIVSVGPEYEPKHPAKKVTNAFIRRGATVKQTKGSILLYNNINLRNWSNAPAIPFFDSVEDY